MENNIPPREDRSSPTYNLDIEALNNLISFARANNPRFKDMSEAKMAEACDVSVTTFKDIRKGRCRKPRVDILYSIVSALGGSIDRLVGLAPTRDISKESAVWDATLVEGYQQRIDTLAAQVESLTHQLAAKDAETERLHAAVLEERTERATAVAVCSQHTNTIDVQAKTIKYQRCVLLGILAIWLLFEILNPSTGITGAIMRLFK
jgi:transcriptional regulator with XRE-family HTH domain